MSCRSVVLFAPLLVLSLCSDDPVGIDTAPEAPAPAILEAQSATEADALSIDTIQASVRVEDQYGDPFEGATVEWDVPGQKFPLSRDTDADGVASISVPEPPIGEFVVQASLPSRRDLGSARFIYTVTNPPPGTIELLGNGEFEGFRESEHEVEFKVLSDGGLPLSNVEIAFEAENGAVNAETEATDFQGVASVIWAFGEEGEQVLVANVEGLVAVEIEGVLLEDEDPPLATFAPIDGMGFASAVNSPGLVAGGIYGGYEGESTFTRPVLRHEDGSVRELRLPSGFERGGLISLSNDGRVLGFLGETAEYGTSQLVWKDDEYELFGLEEECDFRAVPRGNSINSLGVVAGYIRDENEENCSPPRAAYREADGTVHELELGDWSRLFAINDDGLMAGIGTNPENDEFGPFRWQNGSFQWLEVPGYGMVTIGGITDAGMVYGHVREGGTIWISSWSGSEIVKHSFFHGTPEDFIFSMNDDGIGVGCGVYGLSIELGIPFIWSGEEVHTVEGTEDLDVYCLTDINNDGLIVGQGAHANGDFTAIIGTLDF